MRYLKRLVGKLYTNRGIAPALFCLLSLNLLGILVLIALQLDTKPNGYPHQQTHARGPRLSAGWDNQMEIAKNIDSGLGHRFRPYNGPGFKSRDRMIPADQVLHFVMPVPDASETDFVYPLDKTIMKKHLKLEPIEYTDKLLILTPIHNTEKSLARYAQQLISLTYPRDLISIAFGEDDSHDNTLAVAKSVAKDLENAGFPSAQVFHFNITGGLQEQWNKKHDQNLQYARRSHIAKARNLLWRKTLKKEDWVLWIDGDISYLPPDLVQQLLYPDKDVVTPCCLYKKGPHSRNYDKNTWRETRRSIEDQREMPDDMLIVEGYGPTYRIYLPDLRAEGRVVSLDGVGGCSLLVRASWHRKGLIFPETLYLRHIETEGLAKLAKHMGLEVVGLPFVEVFH